MINAHIWRKRIKRFHIFFRRRYRENEKCTAFSQRVAWSTRVSLISRRGLGDSESKNFAADCLSFTGVHNVIPPSPFLSTADSIP